MSTSRPGSPQGAPPPGPGLSDLAVAAKQLSGAEVVALARADQRRCWLAGQRPSVEAYLEQLPALREHPGATFDLAYAEFQLRRELDEAPAPGSTCAVSPR